MVLSSVLSFGQVNPTSGTYNFGVVTYGNATFGGTDTHSPVFVGGDLTLDYSPIGGFANNNASTLKFGNDTRSANLIIRGTIASITSAANNAQVNSGSPVAPNNYPGGFVKIGNQGTLNADLNPNTRIKSGSNYLNLTVCRWLMVVALIQYLLAHQ
jgi:choice-of-anchor A domain-containing protein